MLSKAPYRIARNPWLRPLLVATVFGYMFFLVLIPVFSIFVAAFAEGTRTFFEVLCARETLHALGLTLLLSLSAVTLNAIFGLALAWVLVRHNFPGKKFLNACVDLPFAVSPVVAGYMLILLFGRTGWFHGFVETTGIKILFTFWGMLLATTFVSLPFVIREVIPVLQEIELEQEQAAQTLGANDWQTFWRVTLPSILWGLFYGITLTFARAMGEFGALLVVSGAVIGETETATLLVFRAMDERKYVSAYAVSLLLALISFALLTLLEIIKKKIRSQNLLPGDLN